MICVSQALLICQWQSKMSTLSPNASRIAAISVALQSIIILFTDNAETVCLTQNSHCERMGVFSASVMKKQTGTPFLVTGLVTTIVKRNASFLPSKDLHVLCVESIHHSVALAKIYFLKLVSNNININKYVYNNISHSSAKKTSNKSKKAHLLRDVERIHQNTAFLHEGTSSKAQRF